MGPAAEGCGQPTLTQGSEYLPNVWVIVPPQELTQSKKKESYVMKPQHDMEDKNARMLLHDTSPPPRRTPHHCHL